MPFRYTTLYIRPPRSFLFSVVANVGPGGASRSLAVAYRQGNDIFSLTAYWARVHHFVADTLALIEILSDPANRAPLEAERALAEDWYCWSQGRNKVHINKRPSIMDLPQPPFVPWNKWREPGQQQPQLPWRDDALSEVPFTTRCILLVLLCDDGNANATNCNRMYGIVVFPMHYMAEVWYHDKAIGWDPVKDKQPVKKPDVVLVSPWS